MKIDVLNQRGEKVDKVDLSPEIFGAQINPDLMAQAVRVRLANRRLGTAKTKNRGEVRGGGRKPWRQKGTGRARHGSRRSPIWVGGGHAHAKLPRDYSIKMPRKMKRAALFSALSSQLKDGRLVVVDKLNLEEISTKKAVEILDTLIDKEKTLLVLAGREEVIEKSIKNLGHVRTLEARLLNTYDVLDCQKLMILKDALKVIRRTFLPLVSERADDQLTK